MFATIKNLIPEPRQADQPRRYVGRHRQPDTITGPPREVPAGPAAADLDKPAADPAPTPVAEPV
jgi:hypothetical protein